MNRKVLVAEREEPSSGVARLLSGAFQVRRAPDADAALALCESEGPFAAVVASDDLSDAGVPLLGRVKRDWPDTVRILVAGSDSLDAAIRALHEGAIFRFLRRPLDEATLRDAIEAGLQRFRQLESERLFTEQLQFSRESLLTLTEVLERRLASQVWRLQGLQEFSARLCRADGLEGIAALVAETASAFLDGRAVVVRMRAEGGPAVEAAAGPELSLHAHEQVIASSARELGTIRTDLRSPSGSELRDADRGFLSSLADSAGVAAQNEVHRRERDEAQHATIFALARLAEYRDDETGRHLERVAEYCRLLALGLREDGSHAEEIDDAFVADLVRSAPLHDIGKVGIPDSILFKPGKLTEDEWQVMRKHPTIGAETLLSALITSGERGFLRMGHEIAWCHHEKWDGSGYPRGLAGETIPLSARIMSLADCYDALTTERPYKPAWTHEQAVEHIAQQAGRHFEPAVVSAFLARAGLFDGVRRRLADELAAPVGSAAAS